MKKEEIERLIYRYINSYNTFDIDGMIGTLASDIRFENVSGGEVNAKTSGKAEFEVLARQSVRLFASREQTVKTIKIEGHGKRPLHLVPAEGYGYRYRYKDYE